VRFINNGPEVPDRLVQAHEDGNVVFFCGAGISYPAGLPGFDGLTRSLFEALGEGPNSAEKAALEEKRFDVAIDLLERRIRNRPMVREKIQVILTPKDLVTPASTNTHRAILTLGKSKDNSLRVVTTNFDRISRSGPFSDAVRCSLAPNPKEKPMERPCSSSWVASERQ